MICSIFTLILIFLCQFSSFEMDQIVSHASLSQVSLQVMIFTSTETFSCATLRFFQFVPSLPQKDKREDFSILDSTLLSFSIFPQYISHPSRLMPGKRQTFQFLYQILPFSFEVEQFISSCCYKCSDNSQIALFNFGCFQFV